MRRHGDVMRVDVGNGDSDEWNTIAELPYKTTPMSKLNPALDKAIALKDQLSRFWNEYSKNPEFNIEGAAFRINEDTEYTSKLRAGDGRRMIYVNLAAGALDVMVQNSDLNKIATIKAISIKHLKEQLTKLVKKLRLNESRLAVSLFVGNGDEQSAVVETSIATERRKEFIAEFKQMMEKYK